MNKSWDANIETEATGAGRFVAVLVLVAPVQLGPPVRIQIDGEYGEPEFAEWAALEAFAAMTCCS